MVIFSHPSILTYVLGAQKNRLTETVLLSTHSICFVLEIVKINFLYFVWFDAYIPVNSYGHVGTVSSPNHMFFPGQA